MTKQVRYLPRAIVLKKVKNTNNVQDVGLTK